ncbi:MAG: hypothetical protein K6T91_03825 [Firmicutes bacterium]|nr:hypothetical protein [Bacillota bacterium]
MRARKLLPFPTRLVIIIAAVIAFSAFSIIVALASSSGPTFSSFTPAPGTEATVTMGTLRISLEASDPEKIDQSSIQVKINGHSIPSSDITVSFQEIGYWGLDEDGYETWIVTGYDYTKAKIEARYPVTYNSLTDTGNAVWVSAANQIGNVSSAEWNFNYNKKPVINILSPLDGSTVNTTMPNVSARISDNGTIDTSATTLAIDGNAVNFTFDAGTGVVSYTPSLPLSAGRHDICLNTRDTAENTASASWHFSIPQSNAVFSLAIPADGSTVNSSSPTISIQVDDEVTLDGSTATMVIDGISMKASFTRGTAMVNGQTVSDYTKGTISYTPLSLSNGTHTVVASIRNTNGVPSSFAWSFNVAAPPQITELTPAPESVASSDMPTVSAKIETFSFVSSVKMHLNGVEVVPIYNEVTKVVSFTPLSPLPSDFDQTVTLTVTDAFGLSSTATWHFRTRNCTACHTNFPSTHPMTNCNACHGGGEPIEDCRECHEYQWYPEDHNVSKYSCEYCHNSTYSYKIPVHPADNAAYHNTTSSMELCSECHMTSLVQEHGRRIDPSTGKNLDCYTCHANTRTEVRLAIESKNKDCGACHASSSSHETVHATNALDSKCTTCHKNNLFQEHLNNPTTQTKKLTCDSCHSSTRPEVISAISSGDKHCVSCHSQAHNISLSAAMPSDIPLYSGFRWTVPLEALLWAGESWVPDDFASGGKVLISSRRIDVTGDQVWNFYKNEMAARGWTLASSEPAAGSNFYSVAFTKQAQKAIIWFYGGEDHKTTSPVLASGYRVEILYK